MPAQQLILPLKSIDPDLHEDLGYYVFRQAKYAQMGLPVAEAFVLTPQAFAVFLSQHNLLGKIVSHLQHTDPADPRGLAQTTKTIQKLIRNQVYPEALERDIQAAVRKLGDNSWLTIAHQPPYIKGDATLLHHIRNQWADTYTDTLIHRLLTTPHLSPDRVMPALIIERFYPADISGTIATIDPVSGRKDVLRLQAIWGITPPENNNAFVPDTYLLTKTDRRLIHQERIAQTEYYLLDTYGRIVKKSLPAKLQTNPKLSTDQLATLANLGLTLHHHALEPLEIFWSIAQGKVVLTTTRPLPPTTPITKTTPPTQNLPLLTVGQSASPGYIAAPARIISTPKDIDRLGRGEIAIIPDSHITFLPLLKKAVGLICNTGSITGHLSIAAREAGLPTIVNAPDATKKIKTGQTITINGATGHIYLGSPANLSSASLPQQSSAKDVVLPSNAETVKTATKLLIELSTPQKASHWGRQRVDGIGRIRGEMLLIEYGMHPQKIVRDKKTAQYQSYLTDSLLRLSLAFTDRPIFYQLTDIDTQTAEQLIGGDGAEPKEGNPLLGLHGASRILANPKITELELAAIREVRQVHRGRNLSILLPFVRTKDELASLKRLIAGSGVARSHSCSFQLLVSTPTQCLELDTWQELGLDGITIDVNSLTATTLCIDPDNLEVSHHLNPLAPGVWQLLGLSLQIAKRHRLHTAVMIDALLPYPEYLDQLIRWGAESLIISPHHLDLAHHLIQRSEAKIITK